MVPYVAAPSTIVYVVAGPGPWKVVVVPAALRTSSVPAFRQRGATLTVSPGWKTPFPAASTSMAVASSSGARKAVETEAMLFKACGSYVPADTKA
jgi:hypothetical protein